MNHKNRGDTTIADIHKTRERISDEFAGNIQAITEDAIKRQELSGRLTVSFANTPIQPLHGIGQGIVTEVVSQTPPPSDR